MGNGQLVAAAKINTLDSYRKKWQNLIKKTASYRVSKTEINSILIGYNLKHRSLCEGCSKKRF